MRDTAGKPVGDLFWVGGQLGGVWLAVWGWLGGLGFLTQSLAGRGPGKGEVGPGERYEKCEKCENAKKSTKSLFFKGFANNYKKKHGFPLIL